MASFYDRLFSKLDEKIDSISQGPSVPIDMNKVYEAERDVEQKDAYEDEQSKNFEEKKDEERSERGVETEDDTSLDSNSLLKNVNTKLDAADIAILDNTVRDNSDSSEEDEFGEADATDESDTDDNLNNDSNDEGLELILKDYTKYSTMWSSLINDSKSFPGIESETITLGRKSVREAAIYTVRTMLVGLFYTARFARRAYVKIRSFAEKMLLKKETAAKLWNLRMSNKNYEADEEKLKEFKVKAFTLKQWKEVAKNIVTLANAMDKLEAVVYEKDKDTISKSIKTIADVAKSIGITVDIEKNKIVDNELRKKITFGTVIELGYTSDVLPAVIKDLEAFAKLCPEGHDDDLLKQTKKIFKHLKAESKYLKDKSAEDPNDVKIKNAINLNTVYSIRLDFMTNLTKVVYGVINTLYDQVIDVLRAYKSASSFLENDEIPKKI